MADSNVDLAAYLEDVDRKKTADWADRNGLHFVGVMSFVDNKPAWEAGDHPQCSPDEFMQIQPEWDPGQSTIMHRAGWYTLNLKWERVMTPRGGATKSYHGLFRRGPMTNEQRDLLAKMRGNAKLDGLWSQLPEGYRKNDYSRITKSQMADYLLMAIKEWQDLGSINDAGKFLSVWHYQAEAHRRHEREDGEDESRWMLPPRELTNG